MSGLKPINVFLNGKNPNRIYDRSQSSQTNRAGPAPNPFKVTIILEELGIPYKGVISLLTIRITVIITGIQITIKDPKDPWFVQNINPNGRLPAIEDPNTGVTLWESGAIIEYLVETYDKEGRLSAADTASKWQLKQYLHFQMSGQVSCRQPCAIPRPI